ncbi:MAG TPA: carboxypeptidase-like regulatory domain-containing protein, partial [Thermoleophilaceae bacterium]|nr:carboxypeptidase-like regulatory domain-containing protein [Thermoleophilaceae bacterium]
LAGYRAIKVHDPRRAMRVLFGETSAISSPRDTLFSALCLNRRGRPYKGAIKAAQGCSKPTKLPIGGLAVHPYNQNALGSVFSTSKTKASMPMAYLSRADRLLALAEKYKRVPKGRGIYITEFGFQSRPANALGLSLEGQAKALNESERLFFDDKRIKSVAQFELYDVPDRPGEDIFNTGLRQQDGQAKPALAAWRLPLVVTRKSSRRVEVWGQVRPARGRVRAAVQVARTATGTFRTIKRVRTNRSGYFRFDLRRAGAARLSYRLSWGRHHSRIAKPGRKIRYKRG